MADKQKIALPKNFSVYVGIDFGTDGTGLAYALPDGSVFVHQKWKGYKRSVEVKPKTRILLDANGGFLAFGQPATNSYITMGGEKTGWMLFERFKMALYDRPDTNVDDDNEDDGADSSDKSKASNQEITLKDTLTAINGTEFPSDRVFIEALKYIKSQVFKFFTKNKLQIDNIDDIQWILTVPAIWSEKAKFRMEQWAHRAGLINKQIPNHLKIVYEPDCASLSIQYEIQKLKEEEKKLSIMKASSSRNMKSQETDKKKVDVVPMDKIEQKTEETTVETDSVSQEAERKEKDEESAQNDENDEQNANNDAAPDVDGNEEEAPKQSENDGDDVAMEEKAAKEVDDAKQDENEKEVDGDGDVVHEADPKENDDDGDEAMNKDVVDGDGSNDDDDNDNDDGDGNQKEDENEMKDGAENEEDKVVDDNEAEKEESPKSTKSEKEKNDEVDAEDAPKGDDAPAVVENEEDDAEDEEQQEQADEEEEQVKGDADDTVDEEMEKEKEIGDEEKQSDNEVMTDSKVKMEVDEDDEVENEDDGDEQWLKGEKYILIDAGGGTCDVACHEILGDFAVQEIVHPTGGPWGSTYIDDHFIDFLYKVYQQDWVEEFKKEDPAAYAELIDNFRVAKQEFWKSEKGHKDNDDAAEKAGDGNGDMDELSEVMSIDEKLKLYQDKWHNVQLPFDFCTFLEEKVEESKDEIEDCDLETLVEETEILGQKGLVLMEEEYLKINFVVWTTQMFDLVVDPIINHCVYLLTETIMKEKTNYICLVGGLGSSKYLQHRITEKFGPSSKYGLNIIIPSRPILSVVDGAARFGLQPDYIQARTLAKTYGNAIDPKIEVVDIDALPPGYLEANQYKCDHTKALRVRNIFSVYARKNQTVHIADKPIIRKYKRFNLKQKKVRISVYSSDEQDPKVVKDKPCAKTTVVFPPNSKELSIVVELRFSDTKIRVYAYPEDDPENKKEMQLDYEFQ